jgi:hypothetical protein
MSTIEDAITRLRAEFLELPGLRLKPEQVQRLCGVEQTMCKTALDSLVGERFLCVTVDGRYTRVTEEAISRPRAAKADLRLEQRFVTAS